MRGRSAGSTSRPEPWARRASRRAQGALRTGRLDPQLVVDAEGAITVAWLSSANTVQATRLEPGATQWTDSRDRHPSRRRGLPARRGSERHGHGCLGSRSVRPRGGPGLRQPGRHHARARRVLVGCRRSSSPRPSSIIADLKAVADRTGTVTAVWMQNADRVRAASNQGGGGFTEVPLVEEGIATSINPDLAVTPSGGVVVSWLQPALPPASDVVVVATRDPGGSFTDRLPVADPLDDAIDTGSSSTTPAPPPSCSRPRPARSPTRCTP